MIDNQSIRLGASDIRQLKLILSTIRKHELDQGIEDHQERVSFLDATVSLGWILRANDEVDQEEQP